MKIVDSGLGYKKIISDQGLNHEGIQAGWMEKIVKNDKGKFEYHHFMLPGLTTLKCLKGSLIGWHAKNDSIAYNNFKRDAIKDMNINNLKVFSKHKDLDLDIVFDSKEYIELQKSQENALPRIVAVMLYESDIKTISKELGYPVVNNSKIKTR